MKIPAKDEKAYREGFAEGAKAFYAAIEAHIDPGKAGKLYRWVTHDLEIWQRDITAIPGVPLSPDLGKSEYWDDEDA